MKQNLLNKLWLRVTMLVALMTTALAGTAWAQGDYSTDYTGNVTLSTTGGTSASACVVKIQQGTNTVNSYDGIKAGTSKVAGAVKITVPSGTKYLHLHTAAWNNESVTLAVSPSVYSDDISLTSDSGVSGNSPFTLVSYNKASTDYYKVITFDSALTEATDVTFTATSGKRFVVWGVTAEDEGSTLAVATSVVISDKAITNTDVHVSDEAGSLSATVVAGETTLSGATVTWSGNNDAVATIDASTGAVTLVGAGVVTFTAAYAGVSGEYKASSANYEMTVTDSTPLTGGDVTFVAKADKGNTTQGAGSIVKNGVTFYCSNGILGNGSEYRIYKNSVTTFTLSADAVASGYVIKRIAFTCTGSNPASGFADQEGWTTNVSDGTWTGAAASVSFTASGAQVRATEIVVTIGQQAALASIELSGDYPTTFHVGDDFSHEGIVVTANYEDQTTKDVTASAEFTGYNMATEGAQTVTVSYTENEVTKTTSYTITINEPAPSIDLGDNEINAFAEGTDGFIIVGYKNITTVVAEVFYCDAEGNAATYDWVTASFNGINNLVYVINENTSTEARTAYMKVHALVNDANDVYSELITINQAGVVVDYATLPFSFNAGKADIESTDGLTHVGLGNDYTAAPNTKLRFDNTGDYMILKLNEEPGVLFFDIKGNSLSGDYVFTVQTSTDGETYNDLKNIKAIKGEGQTEAFALDANVRYIKWVYTTKATGNVGLGNIFVDKVQTATVGEAGYATYVAKYNVSFPEGVEAYIATSTGYDQIKEEEYVSLTKVTSVAKGTPVVLKKEGEYTLTPVADPESAEGNLLKASDGTVEGNGTIYVLAKPADKEVGFYAVQKGTTVAEGKAYLEVAKPGVKGFVFAFADQADGIETLSTSTLKGESIYNLAGQRIQKMQKGINIVNGKKVVLK